MASGSFGIFTFGRLLETRHAARRTKLNPEPDYWDKREKMWLSALQPIHLIPIVEYCTRSGDPRLVDELESIISAFNWQIKE